MKGNVALITGSAGLIGAEASRFFIGKGLDIVGIDNNMRRYFFGEEASTLYSRKALENIVGYRHIDGDIRDRKVIENIFEHYGRNISLVIHAAAQPSHDWATAHPSENFDINTAATLHLLEMTKRFAPQAVFIFLSSNKVYGDHVNHHLSLQEFITRYDLLNETGDEGMDIGINETMSIDGSMHSLYGASKAAADLMVQEYGRYYGMQTVCFRCSCLTGPGHAGTEMHGFLAYLMKCAVEGRKYHVIGYNGKQVRDHLHARDVINACWQFYKNPTCGDVFNLGGGRDNACSIIEAISLCAELTNTTMIWDYVENARRGDHMWWITDNGKFQLRYPAWSVSCDLRDMLREIHAAMRERVAA